MMYLTHVMKITLKTKRFLCLFILKSLEVLALPNRPHFLEFMYEFLQNVHFSLILYHNFYSRDKNVIKLLYWNEAIETCSPSPSHYWSWFPWWSKWREQVLNQQDPLTITHVILTFSQLWIRLIWNGTATSGFDICRNLVIRNQTWNSTHMK